MNDLLQRLAGGTLLSDGDANAVADDVLQTPTLFPCLFEGLRSPNNVIRARTAHALERISRSRPDLLTSHLPTILSYATDPVPMVKWHVAMMLGTLATSQKEATQVLPVLFEMTKDAEGVFVRSWAIVSLARIAQTYRDHRDIILVRLRQLEKDSKASIRGKAVKAVYALEHQTSFPAGWIKDEEPH